MRELYSTDEIIVWRDPGGSWPVYYLFTTHPARGCDTDKWYIFVKQVVFLTVNHRGPLPLGKLHSTDEIIVWRDPGGSWACSPPVYDIQWDHPAQAVTQTRGFNVNRSIFSYGESPRTPLRIRELHSTDETIAWRDPGGSWACLLYTLPEAVLKTSGIFVKQVVFLTVNHGGPLPLKELHSTGGNNCVERP